MTIEKDLKECFANARKDEERGKKHKGLLATKPSAEKARDYINKAKDALEYCELYKTRGADYKIPEEWFYTLYYCALAILSKFGIESRSQKCTALFIKYAKESGLIEYDNEFIERIMVYREKDKETDVDKRENARYSPNINIEEVAKEYDKMMKICRNAISQCEEIIFSKKEFKVPKELL